MGSTLSVLVDRTQEAKSGVAAAPERVAPAAGVAPLSPAIGPNTRFVICLDGTILTNGHAAAGAAVFLRAVAGRYMLISNNSRDTGRSMSEKLKRVGFAVADDRIILAGEETVRLVAERWPRARCIILASRVLAHAARKAGLIPVPGEAEVVLVGRDSTWSYQRLAQISNEVVRGAALVSTNAESALIAANGQIIPDTGSIIAAVEAVTGHTANCMFGASLAPLVQMALQRMACVPGDVVVVGARGAGVLATAAANGLRTWAIEPAGPGGSDGFAGFMPLLTGQEA